MILIRGCRMGVCRGSDSWALGRFGPVRLRGIIRVIPPSTLVPSVPSSRVYSVVVVLGAAGVGAGGRGGLGGIKGFGNSEAVNECGGRGGGGGGGDDA